MSLSRVGYNLVDTWQMISFSGREGKNEYYRVRGASIFESLKWIGYDAVMAV